MRVGLTGGVASGKSTVSRMLAELGAVVIDADLLAREVVGRGTDGLEEIVAAFGSQVLTPAGDLDRPALGARVFADEARRRTWRRSSTPGSVPAPPRSRPRRPRRSLVVHDIPLLAETGQGAPSTPWWSWTCRASSRWSGWCASGAGPPAEANSRIAAQASREERRAIATYVIENTGTIEDLRRRVAEVFARLRGVPAS